MSVRYTPQSGRVRYMRDPSPSAIMTYTGVYVEPLNLDWRLVRLADVAHSLANQCRFTGHVRKFYSVAEHSVRAVRAVRRDLPLMDLDSLRWILLHDASEAYLVDIPRPLKSDAYFGRAYRVTESRAMLAVARAFALPHLEPRIVKDIDLRMLATERRDLLPDNGRWDILTGVVPLPGRIEPWTPARAEREFLSEYHRLYPEEAT